MDCVGEIVEAADSPVGATCVIFHGERSAELSSRVDELVFGVRFDVEHEQVHPNRSSSPVPQTLMLFAYEEVLDPTEEAPLYVPYTAASYVTVNREERVYLDEPTEVLYRLGATSAAFDSESSDPGNETVEIHVALRTFIVTVMTELDPLSPLELFGVISGAWGAFSGLIILCFNDVDGTPSLKARWRAAGRLGAKVMPDNLHRLESAKYVAEPSVSRGSRDKASPPVSPPGAGPPGTGASAGLRGSGGAGAGHRAAW